MVLKKCKNCEVDCFRSFQKPCESLQLHSHEIMVVLYLSPLAASSDKQDAGDIKKEKCVVFKKMSDKVLNESVLKNISACLGLEA